MSDLRTVEDLYDTLNKYIHWLAHRHSETNIPHILLEPDDLAGELFVEMVKGWNYYCERDVSDEILIRIIKVMLDNRIKELIYKYHVTFRRGDAELLDLADILELAESGASEVSGVEGLLESNSKVVRFLESLTDEELEVARAVLCMDERIAQQAILMGLRKAFVVANGGTVTLNANLIADALHMERPHARKLWRSMTTKWREIDATE